MNPNKVKLPILYVNNGSDVVVLTDVKPNILYENGKSTNTQLGWKYTVVLPKNGFEKVVIKVESNNATLNSDDFERLSSDGTVWVTFDNCILSMYKDGSGNIAFSGRASDIEVVEGGDL